jgi:hypothetical protein
MSDGLRRALMFRSHDPAGLGGRPPIPLRGGDPVILARRGMSQAAPKKDELVAIESELVKLTVGDGSLSPWSGCFRGCISGGRFSNPRRTIGVEAVGVIAARTRLRGRQYLEALVRSAM